MSNHAEEGKLFLIKMDSLKTSLIGIEYCFYLKDTASNAAQNSKQETEVSILVK